MYLKKSQTFQNKSKKLSVVYVGKVTESNDIMRLTRAGALVIPMKPLLPVAYPTHYICVHNLDLCEPAHHKVQPSAGIYVKQFTK